jgi:hypothetical protein
MTTVCNNNEDLQQALSQIRKLLEGYMSGKVNTDKFIPEYRSLFAVFDPPDIMEKSLSSDDRNQLSAYIKIMGGWFGEYDRLIPRKDDWRYGDWKEPFSWIDTEKYIGWIREILDEAGIILGTAE